MQSQEFDKLIQGDAAKWATALSTPVDQEIQKSELKELIQENEVDIPEDKLSEIHAFINLLVGLKVKEHEIRRRVKSRFNITVA